MNRRALWQEKKSGPIIGHYGLEANAMTVAEELGLEYKDIRIDLNHHEIYRPYGGGSDGSTASSWAMKECANILKQRILGAAIEEANNPPAVGMAIHNAIGKWVAGNARQGSQSFGQGIKNEFSVQSSQFTVEGLNPTSGASGEI